MNESGRNEVPSDVADGGDTRGDGVFAQDLFEFGTVRLGDVVVEFAASGGNGCVGGLHVQVEIHKT